MKKLFLAFVLGVLFILRPASSQQPVQFAQFTITNMHTVATNFVSTNMNALKVTLVGFQAGGVSNAADVFVGPSTNANYYRIGPGEVHVIETQPGTRILLNSWSLRTPTLGDGLLVIYQ